MRAASLTWLAIRELWMSFRVLMLLVLGLLGGIAVSVSQPGLVDVGGLLAWGLGAGGVAAAALAGASVASERRRGRLAWLAVRRVPRAAALFSWGVAVAIPLLVGVAVSALIGWLVAGATLTDLVDPWAYAAVSTAAAIVLLESIAVGLLAGSILDPVPAALAAALVAAGLLSMGLLGAGLLGVTEPPLNPAAGIGLLAELPSLARPVSDALEAMGLALAASAVLLAAGAFAISRADL